VPGLDAGDEATPPARAADAGPAPAPAIDLTESAPPEEVLEQMAHADAINRRLRERGLQLTFALSADGCSLQIELRDTSGELLRVLSAAEAVELAAGSDPE
jgi:hypothetical protein